MPGLLCAIALFAGTCAGLSTPTDADAMVDAATAVSVVMPCLAWLARSRGMLSLSLVLSTCALAGFVSGGSATTSRPVDSFEGPVKAEPELVRFEARLLEAFHAPDAARADLLDEFQPDSDQPPWSAAAELVACHDRDGRRPRHGRVTLSAPTGPHALGAGDLVTGVGWLVGAASPANPGERDARVSAWRSGWVGRLRVDAVPVCVQRPSTWRRLLDEARSFADRSLTCSLEGWCDASTQALVVAMTTGRRLAGYASLRQAFAATGLSHFLAISGFNVAVLFVTAGMVMEATRVPGRIRPWLLMLAALVFLLVVDVEVSVFRAGVAGLMTGASLALGRGWRAGGALATAAVITLVANPNSAWNVGFQLSYLAVLALRHGTGPVEALMHLPAWSHGGAMRGRFARMLAGARTALAASAAAWIASTPVTLAWFGTVNPWCAVASTLLGPLAAALTVTATVAVVVGQVPWVGAMVGAALASLAWLFRLGVSWVGTWPGCSIASPCMPWWWAVLTLLATFGWWCARNPRVRHLSMAAACVSWASALLVCRQGASTNRSPPPGVFRWTSIAVGDGSAHLLECGGTLVLFDAGSISRTGAGSGTIVPALREIGVTHLHAVVVSHPHLDHFSALPEVLDAFPVRRVLLTEAWFRDARPGTAPEAMLACLRRHGVSPERLHEGFVMRQGPVTWRCLHPPQGFRPGAVNDGSAAFLLVHDAMPSRPVALLLGDAQDQSITRMLARRDVLRPWVMELPHHGGWRPIAQALCEWVQPTFVMQSTGARRFGHDRFDPCLRDSVRGVTCRDGALRFSLDPSNPPPTLERWSGTAWTPLRPR